MSTLMASSAVVLPLVTAAATGLVTGRPRLQQGVSLVGALAFLGAGLWLTARAAAGEVATVDFGGWIAPYGIRFELDRLGSVLVLVTGLLGLASLLFLAGEDEPERRPPQLLPLLHGTLAGVAGAFSTADLFNLYVWFEVMLVCALGLLALGARVDRLDAAYKYLLLNLFGTLVLLSAVALAYAVTGHLSFDALASASRRLPPEWRAAILASLGVALLLKSAAFPLYAWLPAAYPVLPTSVLALLAGLLTKVGVYAVLRTSTDLFVPASPVLLEVLGWVAAATMLAGVLGAAYHWDMRRILAFHIISQIGYILLAIALGAGDGTAAGTAALFYTVHHIFVKANLFLVTGLAATAAGSHDLRRIGGLLAARPALAALFAVPALSLVGIPPFSGFWAKVLVVREALLQGRAVWAAVALGVSALTLYSMAKVWAEAFWKPHPLQGWRPARAGAGSAWAATLLLVGVTLAISLAPGVLLDYARAAAGALGRRGAP